MSEIMSELPQEINGCGGGTVVDQTNLRIASIFVIMITSLFGAMFPIVSMRVRVLNVNPNIYLFARYFGSGVIIATGFIHLLNEATGYLSAPCLSPIWDEFPWSFGICLMSIFAIFVVELVSHRWGSSYLQKRGITIIDPRSKSDKILSGESSATASIEEDSEKKMGVEAESGVTHGVDHQIDYADSPMSKIVGIAILEFGIIFHSMILGLLLAVEEDFMILFIVLIFHQMFEGLGLGSRLAILPLAKKWNWVAPVAAATYACITPLGIAIGLGIRTTYDPDTERANLVSGILDSISAGILIYTGLVELLAHDFIYNRQMSSEASNGKVAFAVGSVALGAGLMALLGKWA